MQKLNVSLIQAPGQVTNTDDLAVRYAAMRDQEFARVSRSALTDEEKACHDRELARRDPEKFRDLLAKLEREATGRPRRERTLVADPMPKLGAWPVVSVVFLFIGLIGVMVLLFNHYPVGGPVAVISLACAPGAIRFSKYRQEMRDWNMRQTRTLDL